MKKDTQEEFRRSVAIVGPTASGKSDLALQMAERFDVPIYCCDSVQIYRGLDIGSAKPNAEDQARVRHELLDLVNPDQEFSAGDYSRAASELLRNESAIFCGGTGFYLRSVLYSTSGDASSLERGRDDEERHAFEEHWMAKENEELGAIHRSLLEQDPETAQAIHPNNKVRTLRALWLCHVLREPVSAVRRRDPPQQRLQMRIICLDPGQDALIPRIQERCQRMMRTGWLEEVEKLVEAGYDASHKAMRSLGYKQLLEHFQGQCSLHDAQASIEYETQQFARRQRTFFRRQLPNDSTVRIHRVEDCPWESIAAFLRGEDT